MRAFFQAEVAAILCPRCGSHHITLDSNEAGYFWSCEQCSNDWEEILNCMASSDASPHPPLVQEEVDLPRRNRRKILNRSSMVLVLSICALVFACNWPTRWQMQTTVGLTLWAFGGIVWGIARWQLGASFTGRAEARQLVTTGIYSRIQNPIYISGAIALMGAFLYLDRPLGFLLFFILVPLQVLRARREQGVLSAAFGERYAEYRSKTWL